VREYDFSEVETAIQNLINTALSYHAGKTVSLMKEIVPEYVSTNNRDFTTENTN